MALISQLCKLDGDEDTNPGEYVTNIYAQHLKPYLCLHAATVDDFTEMVSERRKVKLSIWGSSWPYLLANNFGELVGIDSVDVIHVELEHVLLAPVAQLVLLHRKAHRTDRLLQVFVLVVEQGANGDSEPAAGSGQDAGQSGQLQGHHAAQG